jgi:glutathione synthase/RimK-type ligase-like ATP-grasp enzyme
MSVLLLGALDDPVLRRVAEALRRLGVAARIGLSGSGLDPAEFDVWRAEISAVLVRPTGTEAGLNGVEEHALQSWLDLTPALVLNRPSASAICASKPAQLRWLRRWGWEVPPTLVTTSDTEALAFRVRHGEVIVKAVSSTRNRVRRFEGKNDQRLALLSWCPTQFQRRIAGIDHRVHVVGERIFCCLIESEAVDYRQTLWEGTAPKLVLASLPEEVKQRCRHTCRRMGLKLAGIDLRLTPDGRWVIFEVNAMPGFTVFEAEGEAPISAAVAELLARQPAAGNDPAVTRPR